MGKYILRSLLIFSTITTPLISKSQDFALNDVKNQMINDWTRAKAYTIAYVNEMPADKYNFKPSDSVQNFAQQMIHLAIVDMFLVFMATDKQPPAFTWSTDIGETVASQTKDAVLYYITTSYDYCIKTISSLNPTTWSEKKEISKKQKTRFELLGNAFEHQTHHRGQTAIYLRLQGIKPPEANLF